MTGINPTRELSTADMDALALGAWILGTGGGGDPYHKLQNVKQLFKAGGSARLIDPLSLDDGALVAVVSTMGAPLVAQERIPDAHHALRPVRAMEEHLGLPPGLLANSATLEKLCRMDPREAAHYIATGFKNWQREIAGERFTGILASLADTV